VLAPKILISLSMVVLAISVIDNAENAFNAGLDRGGEFWAALIIVETFFLVRIAIIFRKAKNNFTEIERKKFKRLGFWLLLPAGLLLLTGIGLVAFFLTFLALVIASILCLCSAFLISRYKADEPVEADGG
jgi:hypothetical protein